MSRVYNTYCETRDSIYIALEGDVHDGHDYLNQVDKLNEADVLINNYKCHRLTKPDNNYHLKKTAQSKTLK